MEIILSLSMATQLKNAKLPKTATQMEATKKFRVEDDNHEMSFKKGDTFYLYSQNGRYFIIDIDGKDLYKLKLTRDEFGTLSKHKQIELVLPSNTVSIGSPVKGKAVVVEFDGEEDTLDDYYEYSHNFTATKDYKIGSKIFIHKNTNFSMVHSPRSAKIKSIAQFILGKEHKPSSYTWYSVTEADFAPIREDIYKILNAEQNKNDDFIKKHTPFLSKYSLYIEEDDEEGTIYMGSLKGNLGMDIEVINADSLKMDGIIYKVNFVDIKKIAAKLGVVLTKDQLMDKFLAK